MTSITLTWIEILAEILNIYQKGQHFQGAQFIWYTYWRAWSKADFERAGEGHSDRASVQWRSPERTESSCKVALKRLSKVGEQRCVCCAAAEVKQNVTQNACVSSIADIREAGVYAIGFLKFLDLISSQKFQTHCNIITCYSILFNDDLKCYASCFYSFHIVYKIPWWSAGDKRFSLRW